MVFVQWGVGDGSWRGAVGKDEMVGSGECQLLEVWDGDVGVRTGCCLGWVLRGNCR